jgi:hypothetical protein
MMLQFVDLPAETEPTPRETRSDRVLKALRELGGFASLNQIALHAKLDAHQATYGLQSSPVRCVEGGWLLLEDGKARCPTCGGEYKEERP